MSALETKREEEKYSRILEYVTSKKFALSNLGITDKTAFDWRKRGVYLQDKKTKFRMKYSPVEYIWLLLVKECRDFGLPLSSVIKLKEFLISEINVEALLWAIQDSNAESEYFILQQESEDQDAIREKIRKDVVGLEEHVVNSILTSMIISTFLGEKRYVLFIRQDGSCLIETPIKGNLNFSGFLSESCLMIPFDNIVSRFVEKEHTEDLERLEAEQKYENKICEIFDFEFLKKGNVKKKD